MSNLCLNTIALHEEVLSIVRVLSGIGYWNLSLQVLPCRSWCPTFSNSHEHSWSLCASQSFFLSSKDIASSFSLAYVVLVAIIHTSLWDLHLGAATAQHMCLIRRQPMTIKKMIRHYSTPREEVTESLHGKWLSL